MKLKLNIAGLFISLVLAAAVYGQTNAFTYQGRLTDGASAANGTYQMTFALFNLSGGGVQQGSTITNNSVSVVNGVFTVNLDFSPATPFATGADRWLEINVKKAADPGFVLLTPRQQITSSPYSIRTLSAGSADSLSAACAGCVVDANINTVSGTKVTGTVANATNASSATTAGNVSGTVAIANGGTGSGTASGARTNLGLGTLATVSPTGTANTTTFLRGDNTWAPPAGGGSGAFYFSQQSNPGAPTSAFFFPFVTYTGPGTVFGTTLTATMETVLPAATTIDTFTMTLLTTATGAPPTDTITITLVKNGVATGMSATGASNAALNGRLSYTSTGGPIVFAQGDRVAWVMANTNSSPVVVARMTAHAQ